MMNASELRERFANFFIEEGHKKCESSPLIPQNDPTLLFANAGMNQFKDFFTGKANPSSKRAVTIQKCVRAGGKHNDLENVGFTSRHHTFFEMLGNFSFGDYFKKDAIRFAWKLLTEELKIDKNKLYITVHFSDDEAREIWNKQEGVPYERIFTKGDKDNFWEMGEVGPCGPCTEIFYDHGEKHSIPVENPESILDDEGRYVEIWNLVFMQFEKVAGGKLIPLPKPSVDTGAGLERISAIMQGKYNNFDTDLFMPIINQIEKISKQSYQDVKYTNSMRVVADHIKASTMLITDGIMPSNDGRGYVLRRIIRRAIRHLSELGVKDVSFYKLVPAVFEILGKEYPQNAANKELAEKMLLLEEKKFRETLDVGMKHLNDFISQNKSKTLPGDLCFKLYDTFGFPPDLTELILREKSIDFDLHGFNIAMEKQKENSRQNSKFKVADNDLQFFYNIKEKIPCPQFVGYETTSIKAKLLSKDTIGEQHLLVFDQTPFYAESGGQTGDVGTICINGKILAQVNDTQKPVDDLIVHKVNDLSLFEVGQSYELNVDSKSRNLTARNHSCTHLLQSALVEVLGNHIKQAGSIVTPEKLRFDFTHSEALSDEQVQKVENIVNHQIQLGLPVTIKEMTKEQAITAGATALFGEKYGQSVRTIKMGAFSFELCGGTHIGNTSEIGCFKITLETSLASGVRRIEALTSSTCFEYLSGQNNLLRRIERQLSTKGELVIDKINAQQEEFKLKQKEIEALKDKLSAAQGSSLFNEHKEFKNGFLTTVVSINKKENPDLRKLSDSYIEKHPKGLLFLYSYDDNEITFILRTNKNNPNIDCGKLMKSFSSILEGKGGGKADMAQGSGKLNKVDQFMSAINNEIERML